VVCHLSAFGGKADIGRCIAPIISAAFDPFRPVAAQLAVLHNRPADVLA
jgi:hypothetical protein